MIRNTSILASALAAALLVGGAALAPHFIGEARADSCLPTDIIDGSTAQDAAQKMEAAGFMQPHDFKKGCDNFWYAQAMKDGATVNVVLPPGGQPFASNGT
jgi:hypothetical protein